MTKNLNVFMFSRFEDICGSTPLVKISDRLYAKLETFNPTGSVKDRMISYVVKKALKENKITSGMTLCEATSGNSGISLSAAAASLGLECVIFMPNNMSEERKQMMRIYGARIVEAPPSDFEAAIKMRDEFLSSHPESWSPLQFSSLDNTTCHRETTAPEIAMQVATLNKKWVAFVHGSGTGGTIEGVRQYLKNSGRGTTKVCMVLPGESPHGIQGIGDGRDFLAKQSDMDETIVISTQDAIDRSKKFANESGLLVGISSGANLVASERWISANDPDGIVVTILCDRGERYMSIYSS